MAAQKAGREVPASEEIVGQAEEAAVMEEENRDRASTTANTRAASSEEAEAGREASTEGSRGPQTEVRRMAAREAGLLTYAISAVRQGTSETDVRREKETRSERWRPIA